MTVALLLDEMQAPIVAATLRSRGHDVVAVAERDDLRALTDSELFRWAADNHRRIVTENVKDYVPILRKSQQTGEQLAPLLLTSSRTFPRSRRNPGLFIEALHAWLTASDAASRPIEDWLSRVEDQPARGSR